MWIENTNPEQHPTRTLRSELTDGESVEFSSNWTANVSKDVAAALCDEYDHLVPVDTGGETNTTED